MHMSDALVSPAVGVLAGVAAAGLTAYSARATERKVEPGRAALMGVLGAFVFAAQMVNFSIPGTGSSGHLGGGLLLAALLGPHAAFLVITSVLVVQALLFADGGLLALGCNIVNLGFWTCWVAYPLVFRPLAGRDARRLGLACMVAAVVGLEFGALSVVAETTLSGISELPFRTFSFVMLPIHLAIGLVEGLVTAAFLVLVRRARPDLLHLGGLWSAQSPRRLRPVIVALSCAALLTGGGLAWFASAQPDGLEWSLSRVLGSGGMARPDTALHRWLAGVQAETSRLPDHSLGRASPLVEPSSTSGVESSLSGVVGALVTLLVALFIGLVLRSIRSRGQPPRSVRDA
jgi:cobalt/nickel transport system permease protein